MIKSLQDMNKLCNLVLLTFLVSLFMVVDAVGQGFSAKYRYWAIGGTVNVMNYVGDVDPGPSMISPGIKFTRYNFGVVGFRRLGSRTSVRGAISYGRVGGSDFKNSTYSTKGGDVYRKARNLSFFNNIFEIKGDVMIDFIEHRGKYQKRPEFVPYAFIGLAYFHHNPKTRMDGNVYELRDYSTEGQGVVDGAPSKYSLHQISLPIGLGVRYKLSTQLDLSFEIGWRFTTTDYLDDAGGYYPDKAELYAAMGGGDKGMTSVLLSDRSWELVGDPNLVSPAYTVVLDSANNVVRTFVAAGGPSDDPLLDGLARVKEKPKRRDAYIVTGLHLTYIIPSKVICPKFR